MNIINNMSYVDCIMKLTSDEPLNQMSNDMLDAIYEAVFSHKAYHMSREGYILALTKKREEFENWKNVK